jgi:hypothetical protein
MTDRPEGRAVADRSTPYHDSPEAVRAAILKMAGRFERDALRLVEEDCRDSKLVIPTMMAGSYGYTLAGILGWIGREYGDEAGHRAACLADDVLMNGDFHDLNADLDAPPESPA